MPSGIPLPVEHAWALDIANLNVIDNTWCDSGACYLGLALDYDFVVDTASKTGLYGVFGEPYRPHVRRLLQFGVGDALWNNPRSHGCSSCG